MSKTTSLLDTILSSAKEISSNEISSKGQSSIYNKILFKDCVVRQDFLKVRRQLRNKLDSYYTEFLTVAKSGNQERLNDFVKDFAKYYKNTYANLNYEISSLSSKSDQKPTNWKRMFGLLLQAVKEYDTKEIAHNK